MDMDPEAVNQSSNAYGVLGAAAAAVGAFLAPIVMKWGWPWAPKAAEAERESAKAQDSATAAQVANLTDLMREHRSESRTALEKIDGKVDELTERMVRVETVQDREAWSPDERAKRLKR